MAPGGPAAMHAQIEALLNFMSEHTQLARGLLRGSDGRIRSKRLWKSLCNSLNSMGSCTKTVELWQRVWADRKHLAKKLLELQDGQQVLKVEAHQWHQPSEVELKILSIMGEGFGEPQTEARVPAFPLSPPVTQDPEAISATQTSASTPANPHSRSNPQCPLRHSSWSYLDKISKHQIVVHVHEFSDTLPSQQKAELLRWKSKDFKLKAGEMSCLGI